MYSCFVDRLQDGLVNPANLPIWEEEKTMAREALVAMMCGKLYAYPWGATGHVLKVGPHKRHSNVIVLARWMVDHQPPVVDVDHGLWLRCSVFWKGLKDCHD